jgi:hypothetical protein
MGITHRLRQYPEMEVKEFDLHSAPRAFISILFVCDKKKHFMEYVAPHNILHEETDSFFATFMCKGSEGCLVQANER